LFQSTGCVLRGDGVGVDLGERVLKRTRKQLGKRHHEAVTWRRRRRR